MSIDRLMGKAILATILFWQERLFVFARNNLTSRACV